MNATLRAFLAGLIDYAGLFPPASLGWEEALRRYARARAGRDGWILGRFLAPAALLGEMEAPIRRAGFDRAAPLRLSAIAGAAEDEAGARARLEEEGRTIRLLHEARGPDVAVEAIEAKLPASLASSGDAGRIGSFVALLRELAAGACRGPGDIWIEVGASPNWERAATALIGEMRGSPSPDRSPSGRAGFKLRCGGAPPAVVPSTPTVAFAIASCRDAGVPIKCTAGLHHPARRAAGAAGGTGEHGFLSVFAAAIFAEARGWPRDRIAECVSETDARAFEFGEASLVWSGESATEGEIAGARRAFASGFGSCSFEEPRDDLAALGWMEPIEAGER